MGCLNIIHVLLIFRTEYFKAFIEFFIPTIKSANFQIVITRLANDIIVTLWLIS
jgi:hypothetical protein